MKLEEIASEWSWLFDVADFRLLAVSPFGDLFMQEHSGALCLLDINMGELIFADKSGNDPAELFPIAFDMRIATSYIEAGLMPGDGECFAYKNPGVAGGSMEPDNVYVEAVLKYLRFMGDFHNDIQDIADGETAVIHVVNFPRNN